MMPAAQDEWLKQVFGIDVQKGAGSAGVSGADGNQVEAKKAALIKLGKVWAGTEAKIRADLATLENHVEGSYEGDEAGPEAMRVFQKHLQGIFDLFDTSLKTDLEKAAAAKTGEELEQACFQLRSAAGQMSSSIENDPIIPLIDDNPYVSLAVAKTCRSVFAALLQHV